MKDYSFECDNPDCYLFDESNAEDVMKWYLFTRKFPMHKKETETFFAGGREAVMKEREKRTNGSPLNPIDWETE